eukprot:13360496-Ditylum_brightwellii.AAC.1
MDKLIKIDTLREVPEGKSILCNDLLLIIPKPGQPVQWWVLSDMKRGSQNSYLATDPVSYPHPLDILSSLYSG